MGTSALSETVEPPAADPHASVRAEVESRLRREDAAGALRLLGAEAPGQLEWLRGRTGDALREGDIAFACACAEASAALAWGSAGRLAAFGAPAAAAVPDASLSAPKLRHDAAQFRHLRDVGVLGAEAEDRATLYDQWAVRLEGMGAGARLPLEGEALEALGPLLNRIVYVRNAPRLTRALGPWDTEPVERAYQAPPGVAVVDDFLTPEALDALHRFCLDSTIWSSTRHAYGRLGSQFQNGFAAPLLAQIAEELREALPKVIGRRYPLRHMWGYKSPAELAPDVTVHADFAAVNVNFWLTPDDANLDPQTGGMVVYPVDAPAHWTFDMYNARLNDLIRPFLARQGVRAIYVPYRRNRAVIFNSDLFHGTAAVKFRPDYESQRINVTLLYGDRADDLDHRGLARPEVAQPHAWRSAAFRRSH